MCKYTTRKLRIGRVHYTAVGSIRGLGKSGCIRDRVKSLCRTLGGSILRNLAILFVKAPYRMTNMGGCLERRCSGLLAISLVYRNIPSRRDLRTSLHRTVHSVRPAGMACLSFHGRTGKSFYLRYQNFGGSNGPFVFRQKVSCSGSCCPTFFFKGSCHGDYCRYHCTCQRHVSSVSVNSF